MVHYDFFPTFHPAHVCVCVWETWHIEGKNSRSTIKIIDTTQTFWNKISLKLLSEAYGSKIMCLIPLTQENHILRWVLCQVTHNLWFFFLRLLCTTDGTMLCSDVLLSCDIIICQGRRHEAMPPLLFTRRGVVPKGHSFGTLCGAAMVGFLHAQKVKEYFSTFSSHSVPHLAFWEYFPPHKQ